MPNPSHTHTTDESQIMPNPSHTHTHTPTQTTHTTHTHTTHTTYLSIDMGQTDIARKRHDNSSPDNHHDHRHAHGPCPPATHALPCYHHHLWDGYNTGGAHTSVVLFSLSSWSWLACLALYKVRGKRERGRGGQGREGGREGGKCPVSLVPSRVPVPRPPPRPTPATPSASRSLTQSHPALPRQTLLPHNTLDSRHIRDIDDTL